MNPYVAATEYPCLRRARVRIWARQIFDRAPFGPPTTRRLLCALLTGTGAAGMVLALAAVVRTSGVIAVGLTAGALLLVFAVGAGLALVGSDEALAAR